MAIIWTGCSVERDHKLLSFFFDGVPDPSLVKTSADALQFAKATGGTVYAHPPFANNKCWECHQNLSGEEARQVRPDICFKCHATIASEHAKMHGAVAAGACVYCHSPHESTIKHLLKSTAPKLCLQCHSKVSFGNPPAPVHQDLNRDCLECHSGHGGPERFFLRDGWMNVVPQPNATPNPADAKPPSAEPAPAQPSGSPSDPSPPSPVASPPGT